MSFPLTPASAFVARVSTITAATLNLWRTYISQAVDGVGGGAYTPTTKIQILGSAGLEMGGTGVGAWLGLSSRTVVILHPLVLATVVKSVGVGGTDDSGLLTVSDQTASIGGVTVGTGCIISPPAALNTAQASYYILEVTRPPDGATLVSVALETKGITGAAGSLPTYTLVRWTPGGVPAAISTVDVADDHTLGVNWTTTIRTQTITSTSSDAVAIGTYKYGVLIKNPFDVGAGSSSRTYSLKGTYTVTSHRF